MGIYLITAPLGTILSAEMKPIDRQMGKADPPAKPVQKRNRVVLLAVLLTLLAVVLVIVGRAIQERNNRQLLASWTNNFSQRWDHNRSYSTNHRLRRDGLRSIARVAVPLLRHDLNYDPNPKRWFDTARHWAAERLHLETSSADRPPPQVRWRAALTLAELGTDAEAALPDLLGRTRDPADLVRSASAVALGNIGQNSSEVRAALTALLKDRNPDVVVSAAYALWRLQPADQIAAERFASMINSKNLGMISPLLKECGEKALPLAPALREALAQNRSVDARIRAAEALWLIADDKEPALRLTKTFVEEWKAIQARTDLSAVDQSIARSSAEHALASSVLFLSGISEFRATIKPELVAWSTNSASRSNSRAQELLNWLAQAEAENVPRP
jgi:hypothetical protein